MMYYNTTNSHTLHTALRRAMMMVVCVLATLLPLPTMAQVVIGGDVYGGGKMGAVNNGTSTATMVTINNGSVRTVFGGGQEGAVEGSTTVSINGGTIGAEELIGTVHGGVFGAGDGAQAVVSGGSRVTIQGGTICNNVYGGGNEANLVGSTDVILQGGTMQGDVYGGARMANIGGRTFVNIDGANATNDLIVRAVYGGNDISGTIEKNSGVTTLPFSPQVTTITTDWNAFVYATTNTAKKVIIGSLYGGGNGDYNYSTNETDNTKLDLTLKKLNEETGLYEDKLYTVSNKPELANTYIELNGGVYGQVYGGGNMATVTANTVIYSNNATDITTLNSIPGSNAAFLGLLEGTDYHISGDNMVFNYHVSRMYGGNNKEDMAIRPTWHLQKADINNLYSGGNRGDMTHPNGIAIAIQSDDMRINNVYGGCRMADVKPENADNTITEEEIYGYTFEAGYAARVYITGGKINNVYGGNDISGKVYYGTNVEIHGAISGDVYGGGNGSYAYTDQAEWVAAHPADADYYYDPGSNSLGSLYMYRPHVENTLVHITGNDPANPVVVAGGVYCGGNSATLDKNGDQAGATATFRIGRNTIINSVFLGSNGENMVTEDILKRYADKDFSSLTLTNADEFEKYMNGVAVNIIPTLEWDNIEYTTQIGSLIFGGNKGSMTYEGLSKITVPRELIIFEKVVGGCNDACVVEGPNNAAYHGGLRQPGEMIDGENIKVWLDVDAYLIPKKLVLTHDATGRFLDSWEHTWDMTEEISYETFDNQKRTSRTFIDANIYGGCFNSGHVNGGVVINIDQPLIHPDVLSDETIPGTSSTAYEIMVATGEDVYGSAMAVYGGGYGALSEVQGNTHINLSGNAQVLLAFGGGELGTVSGNTEVNFDHEIVFPEKGYNVYKAYGAGYAGLVEGNSTLNLAGGSILRGFGGACNAHVKGVSTAIVGWRDEVKDIYNYGKPYVGNAVFGGNDFGGHVKGNTLREIKVKTAEGEITQKVRSQTYVQYISGELEKALYGGSYGSYNYTDNTIYNRGVPLGGGPMFTSVISDADSTVITTNTFVNIDSKSRSPLDFIGSGVRKDPSMITGIVGGGRGYRNLPGYVAVNQTYLLLHGTIYNERESLMASRIYGGGNLSNVTNTHIDAYSGNFDMMFGGTHGVKTVSMDDNVAYNVGNTLINIYGGMDYATMDIFGAGANSGADVATINLYGGKMNNVHGGAFTEGYTPTTYIDVPIGSTAKVNAIYGGGYGEEEGRPCDVGQSNITFASESAEVEDAIYGGNHTARVTTKTNIAISVPVKNYIGELRDIYGAGYGEETVSGFTLVDLQEGAQVANVFGGGRDGKVYNHYSYYGYTTEGSDAVVEYYSNAPHRHGNWTNAAIQPRTDSEASTDIMTNTLVLIKQGAIVNENVYGGGFGTTAHVSGESYVNLLGGSVKGDIYGGGYAGAMPRMTNATKGYINDELTNQTITTLCAINGGEVRNVFGGGYQGDIEGNTHVTIGISDSTDFHNGVPTIQRSAYGGGEMAEVTDTATVDMYNGYIGYYYDATSRDFTRESHKLLQENGNLYGAGYGVGAIVMHTQVNLWGGIIRNGLYGGGEIATVGRGEVDEINEKRVLTKFTEAGTTQVRMYGGTVEGDVFGGGRGFSYDKTGNMIEDNITYTSGYVFGKTDVGIYRGVIGTDASVAEGHGNVFGGGNIGYVYGGSAAGQSVKYTGETDATNAVFKGHYYYQKDGLSENEKIQETNDINNTTGSRTEDCRVHIEAWCQATDTVTINCKEYQKDEYVPTAALNTLTAADDDAWNSLDKTGITIRNAVFAGGNVSSGSDKIYANAVTVYGNATAAVVDVFSKDFITVGGDGIGGLYGDGNLTFVDGYRELNITNYGTDYYNLNANLTYDEYLNLSDREKGFYDLRYTPIDNDTINFTFDSVTYRYYGKIEETAADEIDEHEFKTMLNAHIQKYALEMVGKWTSTTDTETNIITYTPTETVKFTLGGVTYVFLPKNTYSATQYDEMMANYKLYIKQKMEAKWNINGECSLTAGRMLNTIQRADFCGMFGSRIMLYGAQDRVPEIVDYTKYTINRVGEVSLNQRKAPNDSTEIHGNYFGIYNVVNLLGALTSDVEFSDVRESEGVVEEDLKVKEGDTTKYIKFKYDKFATDPRARNMASSKNMVAQASGVFLELVKEKDEQGNKTYGPVTGVVQLDLINVKPGEGGGYVYAQNQHGTPNKVSDDVKSRQVLSEANAGAYSYANYTYNSTLQPLQTSGNFVHPTKRIVDDCFPRGGYYNEKEANYSNAHMWYIRGEFYVYDQYVSGYTGAAQAYEQNIEIPLTIAAGSEGRMTLQSVNPSKYAYFVGKHYGDKVLKANDSILVEETTYHLNDPISYWDWSQLSITDQSYFVDETYVAICDAKINDTTEYEKGHVLLPEDYSNLVEISQNKAYIKDIHGNYHTDNEDYIEQTDNVFRISNEISHDAGYLITFDITNPLEWDDYYTKLNKDSEYIEKMLESDYKAAVTEETITADDYTIAPTLLCTKSGIYGQREYALDDLVNESVFLSQNSISDSTNNEAAKAAYEAIKDTQAEFTRAYVVTADELSFTHGTTDYHMFKGSYISDSLYTKLADESLKANFEQAYICINTIEVADKEYVLNGELIPASRYNELLEQADNENYTFMYGKELPRYFSPAYVCTKQGNYGGNYFEEKKNYKALDFCGLPRDERNAVNTSDESNVFQNVFQFNFDAFNLLATDFNPDIREYREPYCNTQAVNYTATYAGEGSVDIYKKSGEPYAGDVEKINISKGTTYQRAEYESILNEKAHYMPITVDDVNKEYYVVKQTFEKANIYYPVGKVISKEDYDMLSKNLKDYVAVLKAKTFSTNGTYYYCTEAYRISKLEVSKISSHKGDASYSTTGDTVPQGAIITKAGYDDLPNYQNGFIIQGHAPIQTTTIYVPRESDINNLSQDRVITVVYRYDYKEGSGDDVTQYSEKHIINIHLEFRSGQPSIGDVTPPATVLPNSTVGLSVPSVKKGAFEILGGGWEIFETPEDAYEHKNGVAYKNNATPMYWYQNNYYVAYYAKTYLGKTYSNPVPFSVANYHRMGEVMNHDQRMYIDHKDVDRASKIYLDAASYDPNSIAADFDPNDPLISPNGKTDGKNDLDYFYDLYLETKAGQTTVVDPDKPYVFNSRIKNGANLEFILRSDIAPKKYAVTVEHPDGWTSVGDEGNCFAGILHGNGYTVSGLDNSLFGHLCGSVYNTGVMGSFTGGGIADNGGTRGYAENCWVYTTYTTETPTTKAVIGDGGTIVNSYYREDNAFTEGQAIKKTKSEFEQGKVAYLLNRFHLHKRYSDHKVTASANTYKYYALDAKNNTLTLSDGKYENSHAIYPFGSVNRGYVEDFYIDGDFIYANGEIPLENNERFDSETEMHYPIYPDDYIFFGQRLSYKDDSHNNWPVHINKTDDERIIRKTLNADDANRVYRAPAYYMSKAKDDTYFNINAAFTDKYNGIFVDHNMTAIDFTGYNDHVYSDDTGPVFYTPYLDYEGLVDISINGLTPNLLVYADPQNDATSYKKLNDYLYKPVLAYGDYSKIAPQTNLASIHGHLVDLTDEGEYKATRDHFLVDKENFNAPIAYQFDAGYHMWYQRIPEDDRFANGDGKGWDIVCLPFTAGLVTTHEKGEITHFYGDSKTMHEYWLRELNSVATDGGKIKATFAGPAAGDADDVYPATNNFLYEYYYSKYDDANADDYQLYYKTTPRNYAGYAYLTKTTPYIIAFPGERYYEFDMSGNFAPSNTASTISKLDKQVVTMVSEDNATIAVTDDEKKNRTKEVNGYRFVGTYQKENLSNSYLINDDGDSFVPGTESVPFRGYLVKTSGTQAPPKRIFISGEAEENEPIEEITERGLTIYGKNQAIYIESTLEYEAKVTIYSMSGQVVRHVTVQPMSKEIVPVSSRGIYLVNQKKIAVL